MKKAPATSNLPIEIYKLADVISPNETELEILSGKSCNTIEDAKLGAHILIEKGASKVLVTLGEKGCLWVTADDIIYQPLERNIIPVDTTGAGDCFIGSWAYYFALGFSIQECMKRANVAAGLSVQRKGTQTSYPNKQEVESFFN